MSIVLQNFVQVSQGARVKPMEPLLPGGIQLMNQAGFAVQLSWRQGAIVVTTLVDRAFDAARRFGAKSIGVAGGVSANSRLRADLIYHGEQREMPTFVPSLALSTDNAAMIAAAGLRKLAKGNLRRIITREFPPFPNRPGGLYSIT